MTRPPRIERVHIEGFRSLADVTLAPGPGVTVLIGPNGAGKSNVIRFFDMLSWMLRSRRLSEFVARQGGADDQLFGGSKLTPQLRAEISVRTDVGINEYEFTLTRGHPDRFLFTDERYRFSRQDLDSTASWSTLDAGDSEARLVEAAQSSGYGGHQKTARVVTRLLRDIAPYQFHDTSESSVFKQLWDVSDVLRLRSNGGNLAPVLYHLEREHLSVYEQICRYIKWILPVFDRFDLEEERGRVFLRWMATNRDRSIGAHLTSDGSLRFFALVTLLNLPEEMLPSVVLFDEPELGLHPEAVALVGGMIRSVAHDRQVIVATQSPLLVDEFGLNEIQVLELRDGRTEIKTLNPEEYGEWVENDYTNGQLWRKNLLGGNP